jgi:hypothetical protein
MTTAHLAGCVTRTGVRDTPPGMPEQPTTSELLELTRRSMEATNRGEFDVGVTRFAADVIFDVSSVGLGCFEGAEEVLGYLADWVRAYDVQEMREWRGEALGEDVVFVEVLFESRPRGSENEVNERWAFTVTWRGETISHVVASRDIDGARAAAQRLVAERR